MLDAKLSAFNKKKNYNDLRVTKLKIISNYMNRHKIFTDLTLVEKLKIIKMLERGCYNDTIKLADVSEIRNSWSNVKFTNIYHRLCYKISSNIDVEIVGTDQLVKKIIQGDLDPKSIGSMSSQSIHPEKYAALKSSIADRKSHNININGSTLYKCARCKKSFCTVERQYTRSLDEGATLKVTCEFCGHTWKG